MQFKRTTIAPKGRNKYGNYISSGQISKFVISYNNGGNGNSTTGGGNGGGDDTTTTPDTPDPIQKNYALILSKSQGNFEWDNIVANGTQKDTIQVLGYGDLVMVPTYVGDISIAPAVEDENGEPILDENGRMTIDETNIASNRNWDIKGLPETGITVNVLNNGTSAVTIEVIADTAVTTNTGTLYIPCNIYVGDETRAPYGDNYDENGDLIETEADDYSDWNQASDNCKTLWLEYSFSVLMNTSNSYTLDLTNEIAGINCGSDGEILDGAIRPTCQAKLYFGETLVENATYGISYSQYQNVQGVSIDTKTGIVSFGSNFNFVGTNLELNIYGTDKDYSTTKIMSIHKIYSGKDGSPAVNRWIIVNPDTITYNPNTNTFSNNVITTEVKEQVGDGEPQTVNIPHYYEWDTDNPSNLCDGTIEVEFGRQYLCVALKNDNGEIYESETIPIITDGKNGATGPQGATGQQGDKGPTIRGPIDYNKVNSVRRFCNGVLTNSNYPEDGEFIDIISVLLPGETTRRYYKCVKSHNWNANHINYIGKSGNTISTYWEESDKFNFIATDLLLADQANIANFIFSDGKLVSQATNDDGIPMLELDGNLGVVKANKGIWNAVIWQNFTYVDNGSTLDVNKQNVRLVQSSYDSTYNVYLPKITPELDGARFCVCWDGVGTRSSYSNQFLCVSNNYTSDIDKDYILDFDCMNPKSFTGELLALTKIWCYHFCSGYAELIARSRGTGMGGEWIVATRNGINFWATSKNTYNPSTGEFTYDTPEDQKIETYKQRFIDEQS